MDPLTAWALAVAKVAELFTEIVRGQPEDLRKKAWARWERFMDRIDRLHPDFKDEPAPPADQR